MVGIRFRVHDLSLTGYFKTLCSASVGLHFWHGLSLILQISMIAIKPVHFSNDSPSGIIPEFRGTGKIPIRAGSSPTDGHNDVRKEAVSAPGPYPRVLSGDHH
jgi:hypothetical protein